MHGSFLADAKGLVVIMPPSDWKGKIVWGRLETPKALVMVDGLGMDICAVKGGKLGKGIDGPLPKAFVKFDVGVILWCIEWKPRNVNPKEKWFVLCGSNEDPQVSIIKDYGDHLDPTANNIF